jgi:hypothetical protein
MSEAPRAHVFRAEFSSVVAVESLGLEVDRSGDMRFVARTQGPPPRVDGHLLALEHLEQAPPHFGEHHLDGDGLLWLVSGEATVSIEAPDGEHCQVFGPGDALIVPIGLGHRVQLDQPCSLVHLTPGPPEEHRPCQTRSNVEEL